jgi:peptidyl-dipeptidase A
MKNYLKNSSLLLIIAAVLVFSACGNSKKEEDMNAKLDEFIANFNANVKPLFTEAGEVAWNAEVTGDENYYMELQELSIKISEIFSDSVAFNALKEIKESEKITDELKLRQLNILYNSYLSNQLDKELLEKTIQLETKIGQKYSTYRAVINGKEITDNEIEEILTTSNNSVELKDAWEVSKQIGQEVEKDLLEVVKLRNEAAQELGYNNYHEMSLLLDDQKPEEVEQIFDELDELTRDSYMELKNEIDASLSKKHNISIEELRPWHYQNRFFQEAPKIYEIDLDQYYAKFTKEDITKFTEDYYKSIGFDISDMLASSDLYEKDGKCQHAFCTHIDKEGDVRVLCNVKPNVKWMNTMLHEFGHAVYDKYIDKDLPYILRDPAHTFTTEAIAMMFGRLSTNAQFIQEMTGISNEEKQKIEEVSYLQLRLEQLVFSRWAQVMYRFEKSMYENPEQDLNKLWWDLVEKYQMLHRPEGRNQPDWASKTHIATAPCYYHNYLLGELLASQLHYYITSNIIGSDDFKSHSYYGNEEVGKYLIENVFKPGARFYWNDMIEKATGEKLTAKYYAMQFVD